MPPVSSLSGKIFACWLRKVFLSKYDPTIFEQISPGIGRPKFLHPIDTVDRLPPSETGGLCERLIYRHLRSSFFCFRKGKKFGASRRGSRSPQDREFPSDGCLKVVEYFTMEEEEGDERCETVCGKRL